MNYITIINILYRVRNVTRSIAKILVWVYGIEVVTFFALAIGADAPLPYTSPPAIRFGSSVAVMYLAPILINMVIRKLAASSRRN